MENGRVAYKMMGEGDLPVDAIMRALRSINYEGYISLEWLKSYMPELNDAGVVFPQFTHFMSQYLGAPMNPAVFTTITGKPANTFGLRSI